MNSIRRTYESSFRKRSICASLLSVVLLGSCSGRNGVNVVTMSDNMIDIRSTMHQLYSQPHVWKLHGNHCCTGGSVSATLTMAPLPDIDNGVFDIQGGKTDAASIVIEGSTLLRAQSSEFRNGTTMYYSPESMRTHMSVNLSEKTMALTSSDSDLPTIARIGDVGDAGRATVYAGYPDEAHVIAMSQSTWEVKRSKSRTLFCINRVTVPVNGAIMETEQICHQLSAGGRIGEYASVSVHTTDGKGFDLSTD